MSTTIVIGSDHAAFQAKETVKELLRQRGLQVQDLGVFSEDRSDYPDVAGPLASAVARKDYDRGILLCGTGLGMTYAANRNPGIRAALCWSVDVAVLSRSHNDANILVLPGRVPTLDPLPEIVNAWLDADFSGDARHARRITKIETCGDDG